MIISNRRLAGPSCSANSTPEIEVDPGIEIHASELMSDLVVRINSLRWNFIVRYNARESFKKVDAQKLQKWVQTPGLLFGQLTQEHSFFVPQEVNEVFLKIYGLAQRVFKGEEGPFQLKDVAKQLNECAEKIKTQNTRLGAKWLFDRIKAICKEFKPPEKSEIKQEFLSSFSRLFALPENQTLNDDEIDDAFRKVFAILKHDPQISAKSFTERLGSLLDFEEEDSSSDLCTDLSELLVAHHPYPKSLFERLFEAIQTENTDKIMGMSLVYRSKNLPISLKIEKIEIDKTISEITLYAKNGESARIKVDRYNKQFVYLNYRCLIEGDFETLVEKESSGHIQVEGRSIIQGMCNPFEKDVEYKMDVRPKKMSRPSPNEPKTFIFLPKETSRPSIVFTAQSDGEFTIKTSKEKAPIAQTMKWSTYIKFFRVMAWKLRYLSYPGTLDDKFLYLERSPLTGEATVRKNIREKKETTIYLIKNLLARYRNQDPVILEAMKWINAPSQTTLSKSLFHQLFQDNLMFYALCTNPLITNQYGQEKLNREQMEQVGFELLHIVQLVDLASLDIKDYVESQDVIDHILKAIRLSDSMKGVKGILFMGPTGSGKTTTVCKMMGVPIEEFKQYGRTRVRAKEAPYAQGYEIPKIGFALGLSETLYAQAHGFFPLPPFVKDPRNPFLKPPDEPKYTHLLTRENLKFVDLPGFFDTRGTSYEVVTNISIDRSIEMMDSIPAMIQVVSAESLENNKGQQVLGALKDLESKFPDLFTDEKLQKRLYFLITKAPKGMDENSLRDWLVEISNNLKKEGMKDEKYFTFILNQFDLGRVYLLNIHSKDQRLDLINKIIAEYSEDSDPFKEAYQGGFNSKELQFKLSEVIGSAVHSCATIIENFLQIRAIINETPSRIQELQSQTEKKEQVKEKIKKQGIDVSQDIIDPEEPIFAEIYKEFNEAIKSVEQSIISKRSELQESKTELKKASDKTSNSAYLSNLRDKEKLFDSQLKRYETSLEELKEKRKKRLLDKIDQMSKEVEAEIQQLAAEKRELEQNPDHLKVKLKKLAVTIRHQRSLMEGTYKCSRYFMTPDASEESQVKKSSSTAEKANQFKKMYEEHMAGINKEIESLLNH